MLEQNGWILTFGKRYQVNKMKKDAKKWSYICNKDTSIKCHDTKWNKVKPKYCRKSNYGVVEDGTKWDFKSRTKNLLDVKTILDKLGVPFFLTHGALLGAYRDKDWIKWDDDVELDIFDDIFIDRYNGICNSLMDNGFILRGRKIEHYKKPGEKMNLYRHRESISIRGVYMDPNYENGKYRLTNVFQYLKKFHNNPENIEFKGAVFQAPGPIEEFLEYRYGKDWRTPINVYTSKAAKKANFKVLYERGVRRPGK